MKILWLLVAVLFPLHALAEAQPRIPISSVPITITNPGSYYVTRNLLHTDTNNLVGILITASNVTLDLKGFTLEQAHPSGEGGIIVRPPPSTGIWAQTPATIRNGRVYAWFGTGVVMNGGLMENIRLRSCFTGMLVTNSLVRHCRMDRISEVGMVGTASRFESCTSVATPMGIEFRHGIGFRGYGNTTFWKCKASNLYVGFMPGRNDMLDHCTARRNSVGMDLEGDGINVRRCIVTRNHFRGIEVSASANIIASNLVSFTGVRIIGIEAGGIVLFGSNTLVEANRLIHNRPDAIYDAGISNVVINNIVRPRTE